MRILYIEDQKPLREAVSKHLAEEGFVVDASGDGEEGLFMATENDYDANISVTPAEKSIERSDSIVLLVRGEQGEKRPECGGRGRSYGKKPCPEILVAAGFAEHIVPFR